MEGVFEGSVFDHNACMHESFLVHRWFECLELLGLNIEFFNFVQLGAVEATDYKKLLVVDRGNSTHGALWRRKLLDWLPDVQRYVVALHCVDVVFAVVAAKSVDTVRHGDSS